MAFEQIQILVRVDRDIKISLNFFTDFLGGKMEERFGTLTQPVSATLEINKYLPTASY